MLQQLGHEVLVTKLTIGAAQPYSLNAFMESTGAALHLRRIKTYYGNKKKKLGSHYEISRHKDDGTLLSYSLYDVIIAVILQIKTY
jgi:hypothetical protein